MAINFPNSPVLNDTHTSGGRTWSYDGEKWILVPAPISLDDLSGVDLSTTPPVAGDVLSYDGTNWVPGEGGNSNVTISSTAPADPENGDLWYNNVSNLLYIYDSGSWDTVSGADALPDLDGGNISLPELYEAEVTNGVIAVFDGGVAV